jgi:hypothetical protein
MPLKPHACKVISIFILSHFHSCPSDPLRGQGLHHLIFSSSLERLLSLLSSVPRPCEGPREREGFIYNAVDFDHPLPQAHVWDSAISAPLDSQFLLSFSNRQLAVMRLCNTWPLPAKKYHMLPSMVLHVCNPSIQEVEAGGLWVWDQPGILRESEADLVSA